MTADINILQARAQSLLEAVNHDVDQAIGDHGKITEVVKKLQQEAGEISGELESLQGRVSDDKIAAVKSTLNEVKAALSNAGELGGAIASEKKSSDFMSTVGKCLEAVLAFFASLVEQKPKRTSPTPEERREPEPGPAPAPEPTASAAAPAPAASTLRRRRQAPSSNLICATQNQFDIPGVKETGGPCTYCSLQYLEDALTGKRIDSSKLDEITSTGAEKYRRAGETERTSFDEAKEAFKHTLKPVREAHLMSSESEEDDGFVIKSRNIWKSAIDLLDKSVEEGGAIITIAGARFHTYALLKKEGQFFFYDPHGEPELKIPGNPTYQYTFSNKEEFVKEMDKLRPAMSNFEGNLLTNIEGMDVNVVKLVGR